MTTPSSSAILRQYRSLIREGRRFSDYNVRAYALRTIRTQFEEAVGQGEAVEERLEFGATQLEMLKRQSVISTMFPSGSNVMEALNRTDQLKR